MRKLIFLVFLFLFLSPKNFLVNNVAGAITEAIDLSTSTSCDIDPSTGKNTVSTITFKWYLQAQTNADLRFWKTGDASYTTIENGSIGGGYNQLVQNLPYKQTYDWNLTVQDIGLCVLDCTKTANSTTSVTSQDCSGAITCTPTDSCSSKNYSCGNFINSCGVSVPCGDCPPGYSSCDLTIHKCTAPTNLNIYDCAHRSPGCPSSTYQNCQDSTLSYSFNCNPPSYCAMQNSKLDPAQSTNSCAWANGTAPPPSPELLPSSDLCLLFCDLKPPPTNPPSCDPNSPTSWTCKTAIGPITTTPKDFIKTIFGLILSLSGGIALLLIIISGYKILASQGNPEALKGAREQLTAAIVGLLFIIFALVILQIIGFDILGIPSFK